MLNYNVKGTVYYAYLVHVEVELSVIMLTTCTCVTVDIMCFLIHCIPTCTVFNHLLP